VVVIADRTRVLRIIARLNVGGPAIHATLLTDGLDPARYETRLVTGATTAEEGDYLALHRRTPPPGLVEVPALGRAISPLRDFQAYRRLVRIIRDYRPDIVHTHTAKAGLLGRLAAWRCQVPVIVHTFHGHVFHGYFSRFKEATFVQLERWLARVTSRLVTVSDQVRDEILARGIGRADQFDVVRLGFDLTAFLTCHKRTGEIRNELQLTPATPLVGIVARLVPIKAHEVFLDMAEAVARERPDVVFLIVGDGERRHALESSVRYRELTSRVRFLGWRADLDRVYADLDVVVLTSRNEGSPVALIEAMACAKPVVATRVGGVPELVGASGLLVDVDDTSALARAVLRILASPDLASHLGQSARRRVVPAFSRERLIGDIDALYRRLLAEQS
jgi:glycosyltransferase involved in cell wall biosynthesis